MRTIREFRRPLTVVTTYEIWMSWDGFVSDIRQAVPSLQLAKIWWALLASGSSTRYYASNVLVGGEDIDENPEFRMICHQS